MLMKSKQILLPVVLFFTALSCKSQDIFIPKLTNINPVSYTDVIYRGVKDTVFVATCSGRISKRIKNNPKEIAVAKIEDEVYSLAYHPKRKEIVAATLENGILVINEKNGKVAKRLPLKSTWSISVFYSDNFNFLVTYDQKGNLYVWDVDKNYQEVTLDTALPKGKIVKIDAQNIATIISQKAVYYWDFGKNSLQKEVPVELVRFADMDGAGNFLSIDFNECSKFNSNTNKSEFKVRHPNWPLPDVEDEKQVYDIPYNMQIKAARFAKNKIFTGSIDRTVRIWDKETGELLQTLNKHKATISKIKVSKDEKQVVSVDLKGGIQFWDVD